MLRETELKTSQLQKKLKKVKKQLVVFEYSWNLLSQGEKEIFFQYSLDGVASREFFLGHDAMEATYDLTSAPKKFSQRIHDVIEQLTPTLTDENGTSVYNGGKNIKNRAAKSLILHLMHYWKANGGQVFTLHNDHPVIGVIQKVFFALSDRALSQKLTNVQALLESGHTKAPEIYKRLINDHFYYDIQTREKPPRK